VQGIITWGTYLPYRRLDKSSIAPFVGQGGGKGTRTVASFDEDPTTMAVEAARSALRGRNLTPQQLLFATVSPSYADKTNATVVHAALRMDDSVTALDLGASVRSAVGGLVMAARSGVTTLVTSADIRTGLAGSAEEANGGDAGAAFVLGDSSAGPVAAEILAVASATEEFIDRWRAPGTVRTKVWDEKFSEVTYTPLAKAAWKQALADAKVSADDVAMIAVASPHARVASSVAAKLGVAKVVGDIVPTVGNTGAAHPGLLLASLLENSEPNQVIALVSLTDGADIIILRTTKHLSDARPTLSLDAQVNGGAPLSYGKFLSWRGMMSIEPPRRPEPQRVSATAAARSEKWKYGFIGSRDKTTGSVHLPPLRVSVDGQRTDDMEDAPMADVLGTIATFTIDRLAYSPSPPIVFAVVDFDGGGRLPVELCDIDIDEVKIGRRVRMTFRRLFTVDDIPNYFWKATLVRDN
jgi:3-hydroxy-3-methylglutaryl CoA synthase